MCHGFCAEEKNGSAASELRCRCAWLHHGSGPWTHRIQGCGAIDTRPKAGSPLIVIPTAPSVPPGKGRARGKVGATANLDSSCARRLCNTAGRGEETGFQVEQRNRSRKQEREIAALKPLDNKNPIQGTSRTPLRQTPGGRCAALGSLLSTTWTSRPDRASGQQNKMGQYSISEPSQKRVGIQPALIVSITPAVGSRHAAPILGDRAVP